MKFPLRKIDIIIFFSAFVLAYASDGAFAQTTTWIDAVGDWNNAANWDNGVPDAGKIAKINQDTAQLSAAGSANYVILGDAVGDNGGLVVQTGGALTISNDFTVGNQGSGGFAITGGTITAYNTEIAESAGSFGSGLMSGVGSNLTTTFLTVGESGTGGLLLENGATATSGSVRVAVLGTGGLGVDGTGSMLTINGAGGGSLNVAETTDAVGNLNVTFGGVIALTTANSTVRIGDGGSAMATVDGMGAMITVNGNMVVGEFGTGSLDIKNNGTVSDTDGYIGGASFAFGGPGTGTVNVDGSGSTWTNSASLGLGFEEGSKGTLNVTDGGSVTSATGVIGANAGSSGAVTVDGSGSGWTMTGDLQVGRDGVGSLDISNGGTVTDDNGIIANSPGSKGTVTVDGMGSVWTNGSTVYVGGNAMGPGGSGSLTIRNGGLVEAFDTTIYAGGRVIDDATLDSTQGLTIMHGGYLGGTGTINTSPLLLGGTVTNSGVVSPGDSPGTLTLIANYVQNPNGLLKIEVGGLNAGVNTDLLQVNGGSGSLLDGTLQLIRIKNFTPHLGDRVNIINDTNGHVGAFSHVDLVNWGLLQPMPRYDDPFAVYIVFQLAGSFKSQGLTPNQKATGAAIDRTVGDARGLPLIDFLGNVPVADLPRDLDLIAPEELAAIYEIGFSQAVVHNQELVRRMDDIRYSVPSVEITGASANPPLSDKNAVDKNPMPVVTCPEYRWSVYSNGSGDFAHIGDDDFNAHGYDLETGSVMVGADYRLGRHFALGVDGTYTNSTADLIDNGKIDMDGGSADFYAVAFWKGWFGSHAYVDGAVGGGWNNYDTRRAALLGDTTGHTNGDQLNALLAYGSDWNFGAFSIGTWSSLQYSKIDIDSFTESGSLAPLEFPDQDEDSFRATTGAHASYDFHFGSCGIVRPEVRGAWLHEYNDRSYPIDARFASGAGDLFRVHGPSIGRDAALIGGGVNVQWNPRISTYVYYDGVLGRANYDSNAVSGGIKVSF